MLCAPLTETKKKEDKVKVEELFEVFLKSNLGSNEIKTAGKKAM